MELSLLRGLAVGRDVEFDLGLPQVLAWGNDAWHLL
jgi:hypothetical protein